MFFFVTIADSCPKGILAGFRPLYLLKFARLGKKSMPSYSSHFDSHP